MKYLFVLAKCVTYLIFSGVCNFNGKNGCLKCTTIGEYSHTSHTVVFSTKEDSPRTDENFRAKIYGRHHKLNSPLLKLPIDMVEDFPVADSLHLIDLGIMKRLLVGWRDGNFGTYLTKLCARDIENLDVFLKNCKLPSEIHRAVRSIDCLAYWKASEFRSFFHYLSIIILPDILRADVVEHFLSLFCSITICSTEFYSSLLPLAKEMLKHFVEQYKYFYGSHSITSNVHNLLHVVDEVQKFGPLYKFHAYPFENQLYLIKRMLRQGDKPLAQVAKRICEASTIINPLVTTKTTNKVPYLTTSKNNRIIHFKNFVLSLRPEDKYFMTHKEDIFELKDLLTSGSEKEIKIYGKKFLNKDIIFDIPIKSSFLCMFKVKKPYVVSDDFMVINPDEIKFKLVCVGHEDILYFLPLLHTL